MFFISEEANQLCRRKLIFHHPTPILRHGELWVYHFPREQQVALRCTENHHQVIRTMSLTGAGIIHNATRCSISADEFQTFPELRGATREELRAPTLHLPDNITVVTDFELQRLREIPPLATRQLDDIHDRVTASMQTYDVESLLHSQQTSQLQEKQTNHLIIITTSLCALRIFSILFLLFTHIPYGTYCVCKTDETTPRVKGDSETEDTRGVTQEDSVLFSTYALQQDG